MSIIIKKDFEAIAAVISRTLLPDGSEAWGVKVYVEDWSELFGVNLYSGGRRLLARIACIDHAGAFAMMNVINENAVSIEWEI